MALEHALLVSLAERAGAGMELTRRFDASIGFFWQATHQQIYKVLARMQERDWLSSQVVAQADGPDTKVYVVTPAGHAELRRWLAEPTAPLAARSDLAVRLRGASYAADRTAILDDVRRLIADHLARRELYQQLCARDYPEPAELTGQDLDHYLVLRGGLRLEQFWIDWLTEYLTAHTAKE
ncbi:PadR family transcriptional regulator [Nocardioides dubius]|uniref:PadR family transcriptional regulator n=1 Tax=Nocardioides dubius TaxID=317019 RepID=A0ABP4EEU1_9ACTN